jgi:triosephosphate isomerase
MTTIAVSLKAYLGAEETRRWIAAVGSVARVHAGVLSDRVRLIVFPSFPLIPTSIDLLSGSRVEVGPQDVSAFDDVAVTGAVTAKLLSELGCTVAEIGHAERRRIFGEDDSMVAAKFDAAVRHGLQPLLCVGEDEQEAPADAARAVVAELQSVLGRTASSGTQSVIVAYEPRWAIGRDRPASAEHIATVAQALRESIASDPRIDGQVIYGGSAGPGLLGTLDGSVDGLFLGRFAHDVDALRAVLDEALTVNDRA